jgi:hypothetical protein
MKLFSQKPLLKLIKHSILASAVIFGLFGACEKAQAQELSFGVYPPIIQVNANPPASMTTPMSIQNFGGEELTLNVEYRFFKPRADGTIELLPKNAVQGEDRAIFDKIQLFQGSSVLKSIKLAPQQKKDLNLHIGIPENEPASEYYFTILFVSSQPGKSGENLAVSSGGVSTNVLLSIGPKGRTKGAISEFSAPSLLSHGPVPFKVKVANSSDHFVTIKGNIVVRNMFGDVIGNINLLPVNVLEKSERLIPASGSAEIVNPRILWGEKILLGFYKARLTVSMSEEGPIYIKDLKFFAFPIEALVGILISLGIVVFAWKRAQNKAI